MRENVKEKLVEIAREGFRVATGTKDLLMARHFATELVDRVAGELEGAYSAICPCYKCGRPTAIDPSDPSNFLCPTCREAQAVLRAALASPAPELPEEARKIATMSHDEFNALIGVIVHKDIARFEAVSNILEGSTLQATMGLLSFVMSQNQMTSQDRLLVATILRRAAEYVVENPLEEGAAS